MQNEKRGQCHLCGSVDKLTYEHVPPQKAFNDHKAFIHLGRDIIGRDKFPWDVSGTKAKQHQRGVGWHTLCGKCNNDTGGWYGRAFVDFIYQGYGTLNVIKNLSNTYWIKLTFDRIYPLRIFKQIITMFFSINDPRLSEIHQDLRALALTKNKHGISIKDYGLYLYVLRGDIARYLGLAGILKLDKREVRILSELSAPPFGYVLEINPKNKIEYCDLTFFANNFYYDSCVTLTLDIPIYESNTCFPADYRTKAQIMNDYIQNKLLELQNK